MDKDRRRTERTQGGRVDGTDKEKGCWDRWECSCSWWRSDSSLISKPRYSPPADCVCLREKKERNEEKIIRTNPVCAAEWPRAQIWLSKSVCLCAPENRCTCCRRIVCACMSVCVCHARQSSLVILNGASRDWALSENPVVFRKPTGSEMPLIMRGPAPQDFL